MDNMDINLTSLDAVSICEWVFKVSTCAYNGSICVVSYNPGVLWSNVRFFESEALARDWIEYLASQTAKTK